MLQHITPSVLPLINIINSFNESSDVAILVYRQDVTVGHLENFNFIRLIKDLCNSDVLYDIFNEPSKIFNNVGISLIAY